MHKEKLINQFLMKRGIIKDYFKELFNRKLTTPWFMVNHGGYRKMESVKVFINKIFKGLL